MMPIYRGEDLHEREAGCSCPLCGDGPLEKSCAVAWVIAYTYTTAERARLGVDRLSESDRTKMLETSWRVLERGGFTAAEARELVRDLKR